MVTRIWHGSTPGAKSDEYLNLMRTVAIPDYRSTNQDHRTEGYVWVLTREEMGIGG
jgi:hypothetical protein